MAEKKAFLLRIDPALWAEIERLAQAELRSAVTRKRSQGTGGDRTGD